MDAGEASEKLKEVLESARGKSLVILLSGHPDPDAIGSALAHQRICNEFDIASKIAHVMPVSRPENRALVKLLNIPLTLMESTKDFEPFEYLSLVDTNTVEKKVELPEHLKLLTVVDHHRDQSQAAEAPYTDIRPSYGATSTIYAEFLETGLAPLTGKGQDDMRIATALLFGIETELVRRWKE